MARNTVEVITDDFDGTEGDVTAVEFGYKGVSYVIDLNEKNVAAFEKALGKFVEKAQIVSYGSKPKAKSGKAKSAPTGARRVRGYTVHLGQTEFVNVSEAAKDLGVDKTLVQNAFFDAVGDERPDSVTVKVQVDGKNRNVKFTRS